MYIYCFNLVLRRKRSNIVSKFFIFNVIHVQYRKIFTNNEEIGLLLFVIHIKDKLCKKQGLYLLLSVILNIEWLTVDPTDKKYSAKVSYCIGVNSVDREIILKESHKHLRGMPMFISR